MRTFLAVAVTLLLALGVGALAVRGQAPQEPRGFKPPRVAVVDIAEVFENYQKKKDIEGRFEAEIKVEQAKLDALEAEHKKLVEELKNVQTGSEREKELILKKTQLEYEVKNRQKELFKDFQERQFAALKEIREEIMGDIERYATGMDIDMVLEKKVSAETKGNGPSVHWPIVHYAKPELEITSDVVKRLNAKYRPGAPAAGGGAPAPAPAAPPPGKKR